MIINTLKITAALPSLLFLCFSLNSCQTANYLMWEYNPFEKKEVAAHATQSPQQPAAAPSYHALAAQSHTTHYQPTLPAPAPSKSPTPARVYKPKVTPPAPKPKAILVKGTRAPAPAPKVAKAAQPPKVAAPKPTPKPATAPKTILKNGRAIAASSAPDAVKRAIAAGNDLQTKPYKFGGGHAVLDNDSGYDCSGTVSYALRKAGLMKGSNTSIGFGTYGEPGEGKWITVWSKKGHAFIIVDGLRLDTGGSLIRTGPRWKPGKRNMKGFQPRHPAGY